MSEMQKRQDIRQGTAESEGLEKLKITEKGKNLNRVLSKTCRNGRICKSKKANLHSVLTIMQLQLCRISSFDLQILPFSTSLRQNPVQFFPFFSYFQFF